MISTKNKFTKNAPIVEGGPDVSFYIMDLVGLSTDAKPTMFGGNVVEEGSTFLEENTGKVFIMKADGNWVEL